MNITLSSPIKELMDKLLLDYVTTFKAAPLDANIIISNNMAQSYKSVLGTKIDKNPCPHNIESYRGLTLQPVMDNQTFTILINAKYIDLSMHNINWVSTLIHEITHVYDFKEYYNLVSPQSYDELFDESLHPIFNNWTEFHAMGVGHYYLRKYAIPNFKDAQHANTIRNYDLPAAATQMAAEFDQTDDVKRLQYVVMRFLGRLAVWQHLHPLDFNNAYISQIANGNLWMADLFNILTQYDSLTAIFPYFVDIQRILEKNLCVTE